ncbi:MAG: hypothetical protein JXB49_31310 [Bacteroidales bacterium]|nr:hypothetical protein [Bacteroidales bacterium]
MGVDFSVRRSCNCFNSDIVSSLPEELKSYVVFNQDGHPVFKYPEYSHKKLSDLTFEQREKIEEKYINERLLFDQWVSGICPHWMDQIEVNRWAISYANLNLFGAFLRSIGVSYPLSSLSDDILNGVFDFK